MPGTASGYDPKLALRLANLSALTYESKPRIVETLKAGGYRSVVFFDFLGTMGFLAVAEGREAVLAFRGTREDFGDILADINVMPRLATDDDYPAHGGFVKAILGVWGTDLESDPSMNVSWAGARGVSNALAGLGRNLPLYVTGHSLGGALATLACFDMSLEPAALYTFGCPRVGGKKFRAEFNRRMRDRAFRVVNHLDIVPRVPAPIFYRHCGTRIYYDRSGRRYEGSRQIAGTLQELLLVLALAVELALWLVSLKTIRIPWLSVFSDHRIAEYIAKVERDATPAEGRSP
jgi:hypothetical protein